MIKFICEWRENGTLIQREVWAPNKATARDKCIAIFNKSPENIQQALAQ